MPHLDPKIQEKLALALSGDTELYDNLTAHLATTENEINQEKELAKQWQEKHESSEALNRQYTGQIANLVSKLPMGSAQRPESYQEMKEKIKNESW